MSAPRRALAVALLAVACSRKPDDPRLEFANVGFMLHLPAAMQQALDAAAPGFRSVRINSFRSDVSQYAAEAAGGMQPLFATVADFDGDGTLDAIVEGTLPGDAGLHVIAIMNGPAPKAMEIQRIAVYDADAVGVYLSRPKGSKPGTFLLVNDPDSITTYRYAGGRFVGSKTGN